MIQKGSPTYKQLLVDGIEYNFIFVSFLSILGKGLVIYRISQSKEIISVSALLRIYTVFHMGLLEFGF